jgi:hypothetical protein
MFLDKLAIFDDKFAVAGWIVGANLSQFSYDTYPAGVPAAVGLSPGGGGAIGGPLLHDIGRGRPVHLLSQVNTTFTSGGAPTLIARVVVADNGPLTTNLTPLLQTPDTVIPLATLVAGYRFPFKTLPGKVPRQFVGMQYTVAVAVYTGGTITSALVLGADDHADILGVSP